MTTPKEAAKRVFVDSLYSLLAHTIRGITNHYLQQDIELHIQIVADTANAIANLDSRAGAACMLRTRYKPKSLPKDHHRVMARILIHQHATRDLARICIAHEIYHLILELNNFIDGGRKEYRVVEVNEEVEQACNEFAIELLRRHDKFNKNQEFREEYLYLSDDLFTNPLNLRQAAGWPDGISIDANNHFHKRPPAIQVD